ncbi:ankyrin repeat-containing domain protein, partial [Fusarium oxysporum f. sp. albedinis]
GRPPIILLDFIPEIQLEIASSAGDGSLAKLSQCNRFCQDFFKPYLYSRHVQLKSYEPIERAVVYYSKEAPIISVFKAYMKARGDIRQKMKVKKGYPAALLEAMDVTTFDVASARGYCDVVNFLLEQNYFQVGESIETLLYSLRAGQPKTSKLLIDKGADIWSATAGSALHAAAQGGLPEMVRFLVDEKKQDPNEYHEGFTAIHKAIVSAQKSGDENRFLPTIVSLLKRGAEIDMITQTGHYGVNVHQDRPLTLACELGLFEIATLLLKKGAYPCMKTIIDPKAVLASLQDCYMLKNRDNDAVVDFITELTVRAGDPDLVHPETDPDVVTACSLKALTECAAIRRLPVDLTLALIWLPYLGDDQITAMDRRLIWHIHHEIEDIRTLFDSQDNEKVVLSGSCPSSDVRQILQKWKKDVNDFFNKDRSHQDLRTVTKRSN